MPPTDRPTTEPGPTNPTSNAAFQPPSNDDEVPLGAIVGGVAGGVCLAIIAMLVWKIWRRSMKRTRIEEQETVCITRRNTLRNKRAPAKLQSQSPMLYTPAAAKVKWAASEKDTPMPADCNLVEKKPKVEASVKPGLTVSTTKSKEKDNEPPGGSPTTPSRPKPLRSTKSAGQEAKRASRRPADLTPDVKLPIPPPPTSPPLRAPRHKPSTVSSRSYYSLESGEEYPNSRPARLHSVLSALGNLSDVRTSVHGGNRASVSSSMWSFFSRNSRAARTVASSRYSQATSNSVYSQPEDPIVGVAY
ncbi:hypothetical protein AAF712_011188 [Marasmius tenuissimus]|uniref:Uncharacterized protein n=1 Tax=Marasmius tenuissimus TaxID=585030 RepID=A0ABR2ZLR3_9AGAR|nr:hypothetical protein PM082_016079 [Marasmius tenuissimus]